MISSSVKVVAGIGVNVGILSLAYREDQKIRSVYARMSAEDRKALQIKQAVLNQNPLYRYGDPLMRHFVSTTYDPNSWDARRLRFFVAQDEVKKVTVKNLPE